MPFVTSYERISREEGVQQGKLNFALRILHQQLGELDEAVGKRIEGMSSNRLDDSGDALLKFKSLSDLQAWLQSA